MIGLMAFEDTYSECYNKIILAPLFRELIEEEKTSRSESL
jgi:hypothetical protein